MLCYLDRTFCTYHPACKHGETCSVALTEVVRLAAASFGLPIAQYVEPPNCFLAKDDLPGCFVPKPQPEVIAREQG